MGNVSCKKQGMGHKIPISVFSYKPRLDAESAGNGDIVVALIDNEEVTVKRFFK
ncbi:hypothetical protein SPSIL_035440 [Sporomusa silvacetica DSM 10669]|uniref:LexA repressor n=1 Tax=Sporomusa silvacetica DSM 10669 TaxID=1123289 RepID=A0ABZ3INQ3_9FIRM|nr:LexA repressor [Sporomusa silvacetica DSM 10669]